MTGGREKKSDDFLEGLVMAFSGGIVGLTGGRRSEGKGGKVLSVTSPDVFAMAIAFSGGSGWAEANIVCCRGAGASGLGGVTRSAVMTISLRGDDSGGKGRRKEAG